MFKLIGEIEVFLNDECYSVFSKNNVKFYRGHRNHQLGDYTCKIPDNNENEDTYPKKFERLLAIKKPLWKNFIEFSVSEGRANIFLNRTYFFTHGIKCVHELGEKFGSNKLHEKIFTVSLEKPRNINNVTYLRGKIVYDILKQIIKTCGGTIYEGDNNVPINIKSHFTMVVTTNCKRKIRDEVVVINVGTVLNGNYSNKKSLLTIEDYKKLRTEEINSMCEHKLEINRITNNRDDLVRATIFFDLIQSNIHKTVTLNVENQNPHVKTSCKGALFVMYNYVRLVALIAKFEDLVSSKKYLPLPSMNEINFSLLSEDSEWKLMYDYVLQWPEVIRQSLEQFKEGRPKIHNIFRFLIHFTSEFSLYYHRTRILTDSRPHLMSVLYARIYFLKAIAQVFKNALILILLRPLSKM